MPLRSLVSALVAAASVATASPPVAAQAAPPTAPPTAPAQQQRARELRVQLRDIQARLARVAADTEAAYEEHGESLTNEIAAEQAGDEWRAVAGASTRALHQRVRALYASGGGISVYASLLSASSPGDVVNRYVNVRRVLDSDSTGVDEALGEADRADRAASRHARAVLERGARLRRAAELTDAVSRLLAEHQSLLATADAEVARALEQERRKAAAAALGRAASAERGAGDRFSPVRGARYSCPVGLAHSFVDTWGAPRPGGRRHQGTDVFAPYGAPAYAVTDGVVDKVGDDGGLGGLRVWVRADNGDRFYYAHSSATLVSLGQRVRAGDVIARVGTSGNAVGTPPHVHFEAHPAGRGAVDPYPLLWAICR